jgi:hypothetical protein
LLSFVHFQRQNWPRPILICGNTAKVTNNITDIFSGKNAFLATGSARRTCQSGIYMLILGG